MRLLIAEKPHFARTFNSLGFGHKDTETVFTYPHGLWRYTLPHLSFRDIPYTDMPQQLRPQALPAVVLLTDTDRNPLYSLSEEDSAEDRVAQIDNLSTYLRNHTSDYVEVVCAVDNDRSGFGAARQVLDCLDGNTMPPVYFLKTPSWGSAEVIAAWHNRESNIWTPNSDAEVLSEQHKTKTLFDYWWNANASIVLSELCTWAGLRSHPIMSQTEFMLLSYLAERPRLPVSELLDTLSCWPGTGKYRQHPYAEVGLSTSRHAAIDNALKRGALHEDKEKNTTLISLTDEGERFIYRLHPKSYDRDLPYRLEQWICAGDYGAMRKYINTVFGRQLRYQRANSPGSRMVLRYLTPKAQ